MLAMIKRGILFLAVNILIMITITVSWSLISPFLGLEDPQFGFLIFYCLVFGIGGAFVSLWISKWMAKRMMGVKVIDPQQSSPELKMLVETVHRLARQAQLPKMPEVGIYESPEVNAFATGPSKSNSLVAVSTGLLQNLNQPEVEGVLAHEVAHIANGDMVTMTLIQGIINAMVLLAARLIAKFIVDQMGDRVGYFVYFGIVLALQVVLSLLGAVVVNYFSRHREFRADRGGARLAGSGKMISALKALSGTSPGKSDPSMASLKISGKKGGSILTALFMTHPPLEERIKRLERGL